MTNEELQIIISAQIKDLEKKLEKAEKDVSGFSEKGKKALEAFGKAMGAAGKATVDAMKVTAGAVAAGAAALVGLAESTRESRAETAKLNSAFEAAGGTAETAAETYNGLYRVLGDGGQATEAAAHLAQLTTDQEDLAEWTNICQGVYATFGDSLPIEGLTEAANETAKVGTVTGGLADALNWAGISEDAFNEKLAACNSEAEREKLIRETLNGVYSEAAATYEENAASILAANEAQAKLSASLDALGAAAEPIVTIFKVGIADALASITPHITTITEGLGDMLNGIDGGAEKMAEGINGLITTILTIVTDMLPSVLAVGVQIITALLEGIISVFPTVLSTVLELLPQIIETIITLIPQITGAIIEAIPLLLETLFTVVATIIEGLGELLPTILAQIVAIIPQLIQTIVDNIPVLLEAAINFLLAIVNAIPEILPPLIDALPTIINSILTAVLEAIPQLIDAAITLLLAIVDAIPQILPSLINAIPQIIDSILTTLLDNLPVILDGAIELLFAIINAIPQIIPPLVDAIPQIITTIYKTLLDNLPQIIRCAVELFMGIVTAIPKITGDLISAIGTLLGSALSSIGQGFIDVGKVIGDSLSGSIGQAINWILDKAVGFINTFIKGINWALDLINKIPGVSIAKVQLLEVPKFARGGVVDSATLGVFGEAGAEAVVPLENNLEWLDKLSGMLAERLGGRTGNENIILTIDGKVLAESTAKGINDITLQTGRMPLVFV